MRKLVANVTTLKQKIKGLIRSYDFWEKIFKYYDITPFFIDFTYNEDEDMYEYTLDEDTILDKVYEYIYIQLEDEPISEDYDTDTLIETIIEDNEPDFSESLYNYVEENAEELYEEF